MTITKNHDLIIFLSDQLFCWKKYLQPKGARKSSENLLPRSKFFVFKNLCNVIAINYSIYHIFLVSAKFCSILVYLHTFFGWYVVCLFRRFGINRLWHTSIMDHMGLTVFGAFTESDPRCGQILWFLACPILFLTFWQSVYCIQGRYRKNMWGGARILAERRLIIVWWGVNCNSGGGRVNFLFWRGGARICPPPYKSTR